MDMDVEPPSSEQDRLDIVVNTNIVETDQTHGEEKGANSPTKDEYSEETIIPNAKTGSGDGQVNIYNAETVTNMKPNEPKNGLEFESKEDAYSFYREYARCMGFGITIKASRRSKKSGKFIDIKIACSRFGSKRESTTTVNPRPCIKTGCKASMHMKKRQDGKWFVHSFIKEHNHEICPDDFYFAIRGRNKKVDVVASEKKGLQLALDGGDVQLMLDHFMHMQEINPNFFYAMDFNNEKRLRSVLWVDAKGRHDYKNFCDVIFFDTYYTVNEYKIPFVPIIGVNHHFQYTLFGGALIGDKDTSAYICLMKTWLKAVGGPAPRVVFTDQDNCLREAVADVFPDALHCFSLWHILSRVPEKLGNILSQSDNFVEKLKECISRSWTDEEFEKRWWEMIDKFELMVNDWLHLLFDDRKQWVPTYMRNSFLAGMSTIERSGSVTSSFDKYICKETTFKEFIEHYEVFSKDMHDLEANADFETWHEKPTLKTPSPLEKQMATIYTSIIFKKFQLEVLGAASCQVHKQTQDDGTITYQVDDLEECQNFLVAWNEKELDICCLCHLFEYRGILCRHAILVLQVSGVTSIPQKYILKRWTRSAKARLSEASNRFQYRVERFNNLCKQAIKIGEEGALSQETYDIASQALEEMLKHCVSVNNSVKSFAEPNTLVTLGFADMEEDDYGKNLAKSSKKKRTNKKGKIHLESKRITEQIQDKSRGMEPVNTRGHNLENCCTPQQVTQELEVDSRTTVIESYCSDTRAIVEVDSTIFKNHLENCCTPQQVMQEMEVDSRTTVIESYSSGTRAIVEVDSTIFKNSLETCCTSHSQQFTQEMEVDSRTIAIESNCSAQQNIQGADRLNATSPSHGGSYSCHNHQSTQVLGQSPSLPSDIGQRANRQNMQGYSEIEGNLQDMEQSAASSQTSVHNTCLR